MLSIDENLCKKDSLCAHECPVSIIVLKDKESFPETIEGAESICLGCGHCVAVCPHGALSHESTPIESCTEIDKDLVIDKEQTVQFLRSRRSVRLFKDKQVDNDTLSKLIKVASYAPTGSNLQMVEWTVYSDKEILNEISHLTIDWMRKTLKQNAKTAPPYMAKLIDAWDAGHDAVLRNAPTVVLGMVNKDARNGLVDTTIAMTYLDLAAPKFGLGTCWAGLLQGAMLYDPPVKEVMGITDDYPFHYPMMVGYNRLQSFRMPERKTPRINWR
jgi:nitroreductase/NAD-dependent dihydropyrimidine dehydrogenase PreA subunit